jgi:hypothetical protein
MITNAVIRDEIVCVPSRGADATLVQNAITLGMAPTRMENVSDDVYGMTISHVFTDSTQLLDVHHAQAATVLRFGIYNYVAGKLKKRVYDGGTRANTMLQTLQYAYPIDQFIGTRDPCPDKAGFTDAPYVIGFRDEFPNGEIDPESYVARAITPCEKAQIIIIEDIKDNDQPPCGMVFLTERAMNETTQSQRGMFENIGEQLDHLLFISWSRDSRKVPDNFRRVWAVDHTDVDEHTWYAPYTSATDVIQIPGRKRQNNAVGAGHIDDRRWFPSWIKKQRDYILSQAVKELDMFTVAIPRTHKLVMLFSASNSQNNPESLFTAVRNGAIATGYVRATDTCCTTTHGNELHTVTPDGREFHDWVVEDADRDDVVHYNGFQFGFAYAMKYGGSYSFDRVPIPYFSTMFSWAARGLRLFMRPQDAPSIHYQTLATTQAHYVRWYTSAFHMVEHVPQSSRFNLRSSWLTRRNGFMPTPGPEGGDAIFMDVPVFLSGHKVAFGLLQRIFGLSIRNAFDFTEGNLKAVLGKRPTDPDVFLEQGTTGPFKLWHNALEDMEAILLASHIRGDNGMVAYVRMRVSRLLRHYKHYSYPSELSHVDPSNAKEFIRAVKADYLDSTNGST